MGKKRNRTNVDASNSGLGTLIDHLGPINNACRTAEGIDKIELLWDLGDALLKHDPRASDDLLWSIAERSYITRDLLRYGLIIRRSWADRTELRRILPKLTSYSVFRAALPFLKGNRCGISDHTFKEIVTRLNENSSKATLQFLQELKRTNIGRTHKKGRSVAKMSQMADDARQAVQDLFELASGEVAKILAARDTVGPDVFLVLSQFCMAVAEDGTLPRAEIDAEKLPEPFGKLAHTLLTIASAGRDERAGFRKAVGGITLMQGADLLNALRSDERLEQWKRRHNCQISIQ